MGFKYNVEFVALHITNACSHSCPICYAKGDTRIVHGSLAKIKQVIDALSEAKVKEICLLGGDPTTHPNTIEIARHIHDHGIVASIMSNTLFSSDSMLEEAAKYISAFETTIHHVEPELHDEFCNRERAYAQVMARLRSCAALGKKIGVAVNIIPEIADKTFALISRIVNVEKVPINYVIFQRIIPQGLAAKASTFTLTKQQAEIALRGIKRAHTEFGIEIMVEDPFPLCILPSDLREYMSPCQWGFTKASVNANGDLSRCGADPRYRLGNILETSLLQIWNSSKILRSFRSRAYLPGRCRICPDLNKCGGGCALSCQIDKDHGIDYIYLDYEKIDEEIHGKIQFEVAKQDELSSILQIEWGNFSGYGHIFSADSLKKWYRYNPGMFYVVRDSRNWALGYSTLVPITKNLFELVSNGKYSSLTEFSESDVLRSGDSDYYHIEVIATVPSSIASRAGRFLIKSIGNVLLRKRAKYVSASPITDIGIRLCKYFGFTHVGNQNYSGRSYPIFTLELNLSEFRKRLRRF